jgi:hypothetical protein
LSLSMVLTFRSAQRIVLGSSGSFNCNTNCPRKRNFSSNLDRF